MLGQVGKTRFATNVYVDMISPQSLWSVPHLAPPDS
jgi:hypothetical protein